MGGAEINSSLYVNGRLQSDKVINRLNIIKNQITQLASTNLNVNSNEIKQLTREAGSISAKYLNQESSFTERFLRCFPLGFGSSRKDEISNLNKEILQLPAQIVKQMKLRQNKDEKNKAIVNITRLFLSAERTFSYDGQEYVKSRTSKDEWVLQTKKDFDAELQNGLFLGHNELKCDGNPINSLEEAGDYLKILSSPEAQGAKPQPAKIAPKKQAYVHGIIDMSRSFIFGASKFSYQGETYIKTMKNETLLLQKEKDKNNGVQNGLSLHNDVITCDNKIIESLSEAGDYYKALFSEASNPKIKI